MTHSTLGAVTRATNGSNSAFKSSVGTTTDVFGADDQGDSQGEVVGSHLCQPVRMLDCMCIM